MISEHPGWSRVVRTVLVLAVGLFLFGTVVGTKTVGGWMESVWVACAGLFCVIVLAHTILRFWRPRTQMTEAWLWALRPALIALAVLCGAVLVIMAVGLLYDRGVI